MKTKFFYPAVFHEAEEGGYWISFPDFEHILTQGETVEDAYKMAVDALGLELTDNMYSNSTYPEPSNPKSIVLNEFEQIIIIEFDMLEYRKRTNNTAVKKTLSIPGWLNEEAMSRGINFSAVLQKALMSELEL